MGRPSANYNQRQRTEGKNFQCILYPDSESYDYEICMNNVKQNWAEYYFITHDHDVYENGDLIDVDEDTPDFYVGQVKKPHTHVVACSSTPCLLGNATKKFGLTVTQDKNDMSRFVQKVCNLTSAVRYLSHCDYPDKYQYDWHTIVHKPCSDLARFFKGADYEQGLSQLLAWIQTTECSDMEELMEYAIENHLSAALTRGQSLLNPVLSKYYYIKKSREGNEPSILSIAESTRLHNCAQQIISATTTIAD